MLVDVVVRTFSFRDQAVAVIERDVLLQRGVVGNACRCWKALVIDQRQGL